MVLDVLTAKEPTSPRKRPVVGPHARSKSEGEKPL